MDFIFMVNEIKQGVWVGPVLLIEQSILEINGTLQGVISIKLRLRAR